ncbi:MAG: DNA-binding response regulator [Herminiimonas sp.]|nr:DNA-binding response regulator [Herminiimonas sp.]
MTIACYINDDIVFHQVQSVLSRASFDCERFLSETSLLRTLRRRSFALILVDTDIAPPAEERVFSWLNCRTGESTPVILLSPVHSAEQVALALDAGADDFIAKPFDPIELVARLHAVLRRCNHRSVHRSIELEGFSLDRESRIFLDRGIVIDLTPREFSMAWLLFSSPGIYLSRETISVAIWGVDSEIAGRTIEQHIYKLRKKLQLCVERRVMIRTAYTRGYRLELCGEEALTG